jgi:hypothetical protein
MATGERVLVVSRGEAALAVLKEQLPREVQPLAIAVLQMKEKACGSLKVPSGKSKALSKERNLKTGA